MTGRRPRRHLARKPCIPRRCCDRAAGCSIRAGAAGHVRGPGWGRFGSDSCFGTVAEKMLTLTEGGDTVFGSTRTPFRGPDRKTGSRLATDGYMTSCPRHFFFIRVCPRRFVSTMCAPSQTTWRPAMPRRSKYGVTSFRTTVQDSGRQFRDGESMSEIVRSDARDADGYAAERLDLNHAAHEAAAWMGW